MKLKRVIVYILLLAMAICFVPTIEAAAVQQIQITGSEAVGTWVSSGNLKNAYDDNEQTKWNPQVDRYEYSSGAIFQLGGCYDLTQVELWMENRYYYFDLYVSSDGQEYSLAASVTAQNQEEYYLDGYHCTLSGLTAEKVRYVKLIFTGTQDNSNWITLVEIDFAGTDHYQEQTPLTIGGGQLQGTWANEGVLKNAYDQDDNTRWNPQATDFAQDESVVFTLEEEANLGAVRVLFGSYYYYFTLSVSSDGQSYTQVGQVTAENATAVYTQDKLCTLDDFTAKSVRYVKLTFTGCSQSTKWINFFELRLYEAQDVAEETPEEQPVTNATITGHGLLGTWQKAHATDLNVGPQRAYDGDPDTLWNPVAKNYTSGEGIEFYLDGRYQLSQLKFQTQKREYYFDVWVTADGENYEMIASVTGENAQNYYDENYLCTITFQEGVQAQQVRLLFTGSGNDTLYINFHEIELIGTYHGSVYQSAAITAATTQGTWKTTSGIEKAYDGEVSTRWNPQTTGYNAGESAIFTLDQVHDLSRLELTFGVRYYYFVLSVSSDGENYIQLADVNAQNFDKYYEEGSYVCTLDDLVAKKVQYIKVQFTGNSAATLNAWVCLDEIRVFGYPVLVEQWNVSLQDNLQVNFQLSLPESQMESAQLQLQIGQQTRAVAKNELTRQGYGRYLLSVDLAAAELADQIHITLNTARGGQSSQSYTVRQYALTLLENNSYASYHNVVRQILTYGSAAQRYFGKDDTVLADEGVNNSAIRTVPVEQTADMVINDHSQAVTFYGASLVYLDQIALRFYFATKDTVTFAVNGESCQAEKLADGYRLQVSDIYYQMLDQQVQITVTDSQGGVLEVKYSPMNYIVRMFQKSDEPLKELLQSLYNLHLAAEQLRPDERNNATYLTGATDDLGRPVAPSATGDSQKEVGVFYFLWHGMGGSYLHDVSQILKNNPNAAQSNEAWIAAGGGATGMVHWWGESVFGHYFATDSYVVERDVIMLTDAGVDFIALDYSNNSSFPQQLQVLLKALDKYYKQGYDVPQVTFITKGSSGEQTMLLYQYAYQAYPQYSHLWYRMEGKPVIVANETDNTLTQDCKAYFNFLYPQWPRENYRENGFPWMDFGWWTEDGSQAVFTMNDGRTMMSVSVAQHSGTLAFSSSAFYGDTTNHTRSYHDGANDPAQDAYLYGYNFAEQFDYAIEKDPDIIFVTGWNEWIAGRQNTWTGINGEITDPIIMVDSADINNSRDIQPMRGGYGDNYYMQMIAAIREFKGQLPNNVGLNTQNAQETVTIDIQGSADQWDQVTGFYLDYLEDTAIRNSQGYGNVTYTNNTGRNDIYLMKLTNDADMLYVYVRTAQAITGVEDGQCLSMFISTGSKNNPNWNGYDFVVGRQTPGVVEQYTADGWQTVHTGAYSLSGCELQFAIPLSVLGQSSQNVSISFKFADNCLQENTMDDFYLNGDAAPYGRLNYIYESKGLQ